MGWGNQAYAWFWAWRGGPREQWRRALRTEAMQPWLEVFPAARALTIDRRDVRFTDRRLLTGNLEPDAPVPAFHKDFTAAEQDAFVGEVLLGPGPFRDLVEQRRGPAGDVVVNVRRGDYYDPAHRAEFGMDIQAYLRDALDRVAATGAITSIRVVTDDPQWCRSNLRWLVERTAVLDLATEPRTPVSDLATLAGAPRLVLANSTFSYWGGYLAEVVRRAASTPGDTWAPSGFSRSVNGGRSWLLDDRWQVVDSHPDPADDGAR